VDVKAWGAAPAGAPKTQVARVAATEEALSCRSVAGATEMLQPVPAAPTKSASSNLAANVGPKKFPVYCRQPWCPPACVVTTKDTAECCLERGGAKKKATFSRGLRELFGHHRCPQTYLGGSVDLGAGFGAVLVVGFGVVPVAAGLAAGLVVVPEEAGAGTPDCAL
jgi:hypothetical protein